MISYILNVQYISAEQLNLSHCLTAPTNTTYMCFLKGQKIHSINISRIASLNRNVKEWITPWHLFNYLLLTFRPTPSSHNDITFGGYFIYPSIKLFQCVTRLNNVLVWPLMRAPWLISHLWLNLEDGNLGTQVDIFQRLNAISVQPSTLRSLSCSLLWTEEAVGK